MASHWLNKGMSQTPISYSEDQAQAYDTISEILRSAGVDLANGIVTPPREGKDNIAAVIGKAGSGKTLLLAQLYHALKDAGLNIVSGDYEPTGRKPSDSALQILMTIGLFLVLSLTAFAVVMNFMCP